MSWKEKNTPRLNRRLAEDENARRNVPEGLWIKCGGCSAVLFRDDYEANLHVCPQCGLHHRINARKRLLSIFDKPDENTPSDFSASEIGSEVSPVDALSFVDSRPYPVRLEEAVSATGESDALVCAHGLLEGKPIVACAFEFDFMGGSMGSVVGERFARAAMLALEKGYPLITFAASGGARMQEGLLSLMQMAKTTAVLGKLSEAKIPYISVLTDPTMGGVSASFAFVGDIVIAEPGALIGFAGPRVIEQTVRQTLPVGFQRAEFLLEHGAVDMIVDRRDMRSTLSNLIAMLTANIAAVTPSASSHA